MIKEHNTINFFFGNIIKNTGLTNAEIERQKHKEKGLLNPLMKSCINTVTPLKTQTEVSNSLSKGKVVLNMDGENTKVTYTRKDIMKNVASYTVSMGSKNISKTSEISTINIELDLDKLLEQQLRSETSEINDTVIKAPISWSTNIGQVVDGKSSLEEAASVLPFKLDPVATVLMSKDKFNLNVSLKFGNDTIELGANTTLVIKGQSVEDKVKDTIMIGNNSNINIDSKMFFDYKNDILIAGNNSKIDIYEENVIDNGNDVLIAGNNSEINIKMKNIVDNSDEVLIFGNNSRLILEGENISDNSNDTIILGNNAELIIKGMSGISSGNNTLILGNNVKFLIDNSSNAGIFDFKKMRDGEGYKLEISQEMLDEIERLGKNLEKVRVGDKSLKDMLDEIIKYGRDYFKIIKNQKEEEKNNKKIKQMEKEFIDMIMQLSMYRYFNRQLSSVQFVTSFVNERYKNIKNNNVNSNTIRVKSWAM